jgi:hypothetical protein
MKITLQLVVCDDDDYEETWFCRKFYVVDALG